MAKALRARLDALEAVMDERPTIIIVEIVDGMHGAPIPDDHVMGLSAHDMTLMRKEGETVADLDARAEAIPPQVPGGTRVWMRQYREEKHEQD